MNQQKCILKRLKCFLDLTFTVKSLNIVVDKQLKIFIFFLLNSFSIFNFNYDEKAGNYSGQIVFLHYIDWIGEFRAIARPDGKF
jgi:hypothetical protein